MTVVVLATIPAIAQSTGQLSGTITLSETGTSVHGASVLIVELGRTALSEDDGSFNFNNVPPGTYHVIAHLEYLFTETAKTATVEAGGEASVEFRLSLTAEKQEITVTASAKHETVLESFQDVESFDAYDLAESTAASLGEALDNRVGTGIAKRSFGPGNSRPIIRGFDGDRVLIMEDGISTGTLSSQSGDHGEVMNIAQLDRLEVVKGPATLLYSGNAMGGTVNAISRHHEHEPHPHQGLRGYASGSGGTANSLAAGGAGFELGVGKMQVWGQGGTVQTGDYTAPMLGKVPNSRSELVNGGGGFGWYGNRFYATVELKADRGDAGVPFAQEYHGGHEHEEEEGEEGDEEEEGHEEEAEGIGIQSRRESYRVNWGVLNLGGPITEVEVKLSYVDWQHDEIEQFEDGGSEIGTVFNNGRFAYRGMFEQAKRGPLSGRFGVWGTSRDYEATGEEALAPPVSQSGFAIFGLEEFDFECLKVQFGARVETQRYHPAHAEREGLDHHEGEEEEELVPPDAISRSFTGGSFAAGIHADLWADGAFVANFARSYRAPALEELYNFGPHVGNLAFEIGNPSLRAEVGRGIDLSLRHRSGRVRSEFNYFYYDFDNFVFPFAIGESVSELLKIEYTQRNARFTGAEANLGVGVHPNLWLNLGLDYVDAQDPTTRTYLPRIPPLRGRIGANLRVRGLRFAPEFVLASEQNRTFTNETTTPGYTVMNLKASYTYARPHLAHQFSVNVFNIGDQLYRNHSSFIKDLAPEIGRGVRFTYMVRFF